MPSLDFHNLQHYLKAYYALLSSKDRSTLLRAYLHVFQLTRAHFYKLLNNNTPAKTNFMMFFADAYGVSIHDLYEKPKEPTCLTEDFKKKYQTPSKEERRESKKKPRKQKKALLSR